MEKVKTRTAELWTDEHDILWVRLLPVVEIDKEDVADNLLVLRNLSKGQPCLRMIDLRTKWKMTPEAEEIFKKSDTPEKTIARAVLTGSIADKLVKSLLARLYKPEVPLKFFTSEQEAVQWLLTYRK